MIYSVISSGEVAAKIYRDSRIERSNFHLDAIEWFGEAMGLIGGVPSEVTSEAAGTVTNYMVPLPSPMTHLLAVLHAPLEEGRRQGETNEVFQERVLSAPVTKLERAGGLQSARRVGSDRGYESYTLTAGYVQTSFETGSVVFLYKRPPVDNEGYPLIPDHPSWKQALTFYVLLKLSEGGWDHPRLSYTELELRWLKYCTQARTAGAYPDLDMLNKIRKMWVRPMPNTTLPDTLFEETFGEPRVGIYRPMGTPGIDPTDPVDPPDPPDPNAPGPTALTTADAIVVVTQDGYYLYPVTPSDDYLVGADGIPPVTADSQYLYPTPQP